MRRFGFLVLAGVIGLGAVTTSCSNTVSKADFKKQLDDAGLGTSADTQCLVDNLEQAGFQFHAYGNLSTDDQTKLSDAAQKCVKLDGLTPSTPDISDPTASAG